MPHHCWNTASTTPISNGLLTPEVNNSLRPADCRSLTTVASTSASACSAHLLPPMQARMRRACSWRPRFAGQRGLSGTNSVFFLRVPLAFVVVLVLALAYAVYRIDDSRKPQDDGLS